MYLKVKSKKIKNLSAKISQAKNNLVVSILNKKGYECDNSQISQIKANRKLNSDINISKENKISIMPFIRPLLYKPIYKNSHFYYNSNNKNN